MGAALAYHGLILTVWLPGMVALIGVQFWDFWRTLICSLHLVMNS